MLFLSSLRRLKRRKLTTAVVLCLILIAGGLVYFLFFSDFPGGMRPSYNAVDDDWRLTREARTALPIIAAIRHYHDREGHYPANAAEIGVSFASATISGDLINGWSYYHYPTPQPDGFVLSRRLGWDPSLQFHWTGTSGSWVFDPGDGSPEKPVALSP